MLSWFRKPTPTPNVFDYLPTPPFAPGMLPLIGQYHPIAGGVVAQFDAVWAAPGGQRNYGGASINVGGGLRLHQSVSTPEHSRLTPISSGVVLLGFNGVGFVGDTRSGGWGWGDVAKIKMFLNSLALSLYVGGAVFFEHKSDFSGTDREKLGYLCANLLEFFQKYGPDWPFVDDEI